MHYLNYGVNSKLKKTIKVFYGLKQTNKYFHCSNESIFEINLLKLLMTDIIFKHSSIKAFTSAYNHLYAPKRQERYFLYSKRITEAFYAYNLTKYYQDFLGTVFTCNISIY